MHALLMVGLTQGLLSAKTLPHAMRSTNSRQDNRYLERKFEAYLE